MGGFSYFDKSYLELVKECGVNIVSSAFSANSGLDSVKCTLEGYPEKVGVACNISQNPSDYAINIRESVKNVKESGLKIFIGGPHLKVSDIQNMNPFASSKWKGNYEIWRKIVEIFKGEPAVAGWMLCDEPNVSFFWGLRELRYLIMEEEQGLIEMTPVGSDKFNFDQINEKIDLISTDSKIHKIIHCNLYPYLVNSPSNIKKLNGVLYGNQNYYPGWGPVSDYDDYYNSYVSNLEPSMVSFDAYPFSKNIEKNETKLNLSTRFFETLAFYSQQLVSDIPYWSYIQTTDITIVNRYWSSVENKIIREEKSYGTCSSLGMMKFAIFCSLAFGAEGLVYWRMTPGPGPDTTALGEVHEITNGPISNACEKTPVFNVLKQVTQQVRKIQSCFIRSSNVSSRVVRVGVTKWPDGDVGRYQAVGLYKIDISKIATDTYFDGLVTSINSAGKGWVVSLITKSYDRNSSSKQKVEQILTIVNSDWENEQELDIKFKEYVKDETGVTATPIIPSKEDDVAISSDDKSRISIPSSGTIIKFNGIVSAGDWKIFTRSYTI